ncbi:hypothetical protein SAMN05216548_11451 [Faunimonas pinastri]|uniref:Uncharacterized protein n=1 Tax=Faunimonas pinastri TaxID=1855383 RepID=A0A1H9MU21_9HYPH|nr:hypothetical protein [Faunimonas pinastri]SER27220.1 hypothetical protein SAMN05216548_11451 [Faunimonas pinastri]
MRSVEQMVRAHTLADVSDLMLALAQGDDLVDINTHRVTDRIELARLCNRAMKFAGFPQAYEKAARSCGWLVDDGLFVHHQQETAASASPTDETGWEDLCLEYGIDLNDADTSECWVVTDWLAYHLEQRGERIDFDFGGLTLWARTTGGRPVWCDPVIQDIFGAQFGAPAINKHTELLAHPASIPDDLPLIADSAAQVACRTLVNTYCNDPEDVDWSDVQTALQAALRAFGLPSDYPDQAHALHTFGNPGETR